MLEERRKDAADVCWLQKWHSAVAAGRQMAESTLEEQKFVVGCAQIFLPRDALHVFLVSFLPEAEANRLAVKRGLAGRQGTGVECGPAVKRATDTQQASGFWVLSF